MKQRIPTIEEFINEGNDWKRVKSYMKKDSPKVKVQIKKMADKYQDGKFGGIKYEVTVDNYKFIYTAYDASTQEENNLIRTIGAIIDDGKNIEENPDFLRK